MLLFLPAPAQAAARLGGDPAAGERLARDVCAICHAVSDSDEQPPLGRAGAPPLYAVARRPATNPVTLRQFLQKPHGVMEPLKIAPDDIENLVAFILSLAPLHTTFAWPGAATRLR